MRPLEGGLVGLRRSLRVSSGVPPRTTRIGARSIRSAGATLLPLLCVGLSGLLLLSVSFCGNGTVGDDPKVPDMGLPEDRSEGVRRGDEQTTEVAVRNGAEQCGFRESPAALIDVGERYNQKQGVQSSQIRARILSEPYPSFHKVVMEDGNCRYLKATFGFCEPSCDYYETCNADGKCVELHPDGVSGGVLTVTGLGEPIQIQSSGRHPGSYSSSWGALPPVLFEAGDAIVADLSGAEFPAVTLAATGVALVDTKLAATGFEMKDGQDAVLEWTAGPDPEACIQVVLNGFNAAHGQPLNDIIWCEGPDDGTMKIPQSMVEAFPHGETPDAVAGHDWPWSELTRYTRDVTETALGPAELVVRSTVYFRFSHPE